MEVNYTEFVKFDFLTGGSEGKMAILVNFKFFSLILSLKF